LLDLDHAWTIDAHAFCSRSANSPFHGWRVVGRAQRTIVGGQTKFTQARA